jgi:CheY-like chemotaxis protein
MRYSKVFLIDDDQDDQELFLMALEQIDPSLECTVHSDAKTALQAIRGAPAPPDVIFLDLNMPLMTGQQFLAELNKQTATSKIPVIILSTSSDQPSIDETRALGAERFITKPNNFKELNNILKKILV